MLLDRTMPIVSGEEALAAMRRARPHLPVIIVSGYSEESISPSIADNRPDGFLKKPFLPEELSARVSEVLAER